MSREKFLFILVPVMNSHHFCQSSSISSELVIKKTEFTQISGHLKSDRIAKTAKGHRAETRNLFSLLDLTIQHVRD